MQRRSALVVSFLFVVSLAAFWLLGHFLQVRNSQHRILRLLPSSPVEQQQQQEPEHSISSINEALVFVTVLQSPQEMSNLRRLVGSLHRFRFDGIQVPLLMVYARNLSQFQVEEINLWSHTFYFDLALTISPGSLAISDFAVFHSFYVRLVLLDISVSQFGHAIFIESSQTINSVEDYSLLQESLISHGSVMLLDSNPHSAPSLLGYVQQSQSFDTDVRGHLKCIRLRQCSFDQFTLIAHSLTGLRNQTVSSQQASRYFCYIQLREDILYNNAVLNSLINSLSGKHENLPIQQQSRIKIGLGVATKSNTKKFDQATLYRSFFTTLFATISKEEVLHFHYNIYIGYDHGDILLDDQLHLNHAIQLIESLTPSFIAPSIQIHWIRLPPSNGWLTAVWNTLFSHSMIQNQDHYFLQLNDDLEFQTVGWTTALTKILKSHNDIGVVGPNDRKWNCTVLTQAMVSRKHYELFGWFYPPQIKDWYSDFWLTKVYGPERTYCQHNITVRNLQNQGSRYKLCNHPYWISALHDGQRRLESEEGEEIIGGAMTTRILTVSS